MKKTLFFSLFTLFVLLITIAFLKNRSFQYPSASDTDAKTLAEKERITRFWKVYREATEHRMAGRTREAAEGYRKALTLNGEHEDALYYLGNMCMELGEYQAAAESWQRLAQVNPHSARAHLQLGDLHLNFEQKEFFNLSRAEEEFQHALQINQEETGPTLRLGHVALIRGDLPKAQNYFNAVIVTNFKSVEAHFLNGYVAWKTGNVSTAETMFSEAVKFSQADKPVQGILSEGDTKTGRAHVAPPSSKRQTLFQDCCSDLADLNESSISEQMRARYEKLSTLLKQMRKSQ